VVVENIFRRWLDAGHTTVGIAIDAVREVGNPTILATLTIISALLPMGWVSGLMGPYMRPIPVLGSSAMFFSLVAAFIFTPWFAVRMRPASVAAFRKAAEREQRTQRIVGKIYEPIIRPLINNRSLGILFLVSIIGLTAAVCSLFYFKVVAVKMLPFDNKPEFNVVVNMPEGTALPVTANVVQQLAETIRAEMPEIVAIQTYVGTASPFNFNGLVRHYYLRQESWMGDIQVMLLDKNERERSSHELSVVAREILAPIAERMGARIQVVEMPPGPPVLQTVTAEIYGPDDLTRRQTARDMVSMFEDVEGLVDVDSYMADAHSYWHFTRRHYRNHQPQPVYGDGRIQAG
jgi:multidrug efflux pump subunit AcrB